MRSRGITALIAMLAATLVAVLAGQPARAEDVPPAPGSWAELYPPFFNEDVHKCLDVPRGSSAPGLGLQVFRCHGYASNGHPQRWLIIAAGMSAAGNQLYLIKNIASDLCVTPSIGELSVFQARCSPGSPRQLWFQELTPLFGATFALRNFNSPDHCLATRNGSGEDNTPVVIAPCTISNPLHQNTKRQVWSFG